MPKSMRYYIVKAEDQPVVRSVPVMRQQADAIGSRQRELPQSAPEPRQPSVSSVLRLALRRKRDDDGLV